jgi:hypothetical protein
VAIKRSITPADVIAVAERELRKRMPELPEDFQVSLAQEIRVGLPSVFSSEEVSITAVPHTTLKVGRCQMNVTVKTESAPSTTFPVYLDVRSIRTSLSTPQIIQPVTSVNPLSPISSPVVVKVRQRVNLLVKGKNVIISAIGEAQQDGRVGDMIRVMNIDSKKVITGKVVSAGTVELELGGQ